MTLLLRPLRFVLPLLQLATFAMLLRSVALDRWITVFAAVLLLTATYFAQRGRTWGVALSFALGVTFASVWALGIAPFAFAILGGLAVVPFVSLLRHFARFDRGATVAMATIAAGLGATGAVAWKQYALDLFRALPVLSPSIYPHHSLGLLALVVAGLFARRLLPAARSEESETSGEVEARVRVASTETRVSDEEAASLAELESELDGREAPEPRRARLPN